MDCSTPGLPVHHQMKTDLFQSCGHCWVFQICWHTEWSTFTAPSFRIWNSCVLGLCHSFKSCALPLSLLLQFHPQIFFCKRKNVSSLVSIQGLHVVFGSVSLYCLCLQRSLVCLCHSWPGSLSRLSPDKVVLVLKKPPANAGDIRDVGSIPGSWRSPGGGHGNPLQYSHGQRSLVGYSS